MTTQNSPIEDGHDDATTGDKLAGLVEQVRADYQLGTTTDAAAMLRQRLTDAGYALGDAEFATLLDEVERP
jgi:hypothetical protein